jgi:lipooligosaccharide transport system ATP-binding protein
MAPEAKGPIVRCGRLMKRFGTLRAVDEISFEIPEGICFGILGPNGAGKTTTLRMLLGQSPRSSGTLEVLGQDIDHGRRYIRQRTGIVPQADNLDPDFTVAENLSMYGSYFRLDHQTVQKRIPELLSMVELLARADDRISTLSGGMKRRLTLARALVNDPDLLVLDEPTTGLDPQARHMIWSLVHRLKRNGRTILLTTHYMEEAERLCDELIIVDSGKLIAQGSPDALIRQHCESDVLEIRGVGTDLNLNKLPESFRSELSGDSAYLYSNDSHALLAYAANMGEVTALHRKTGLEDVFLRLTGRGLRG